MPTRAYLAACRYCRSQVVVAKCFDGRWRTFEQESTPALGWWWSRSSEAMVSADYTRDHPAGGMHQLHWCCAVRPVASSISALSLLNPRS